MDIKRIISLIDNLLPKDAIYKIKNDIDKLSQEQQEMVCEKIQTLAPTLPSPRVVFWFGSFAFGSLGVGRFMIGDKLLGFIRLSLCLLGWTTVMFISPLDDYDNKTAGFIYCIDLIVMIIWWIVDLFIVGKKLRQKNLDKILSIINEVANNNITKT